MGGMGQPELRPNRKAVELQNQVLESVYGHRGAIRGFEQGSCINQYLLGKNKKIRKPRLVKPKTEFIAFYFYNRHGFRYTLIRGLNCLSRRGSPFLSHDPNFADKKTET